jgi:hypothetical protein
MIAAADVTRGAHAVERLVCSLPISPENADDARAALRLAHVAGALLTENATLRRRVTALKARHRVPRLRSEP